MLIRGIDFDGSMSEQTEIRKRSRQCEWAAKERERIMQILGKRCRRCGVDFCLTFDCIKPTGDGHHRLSSVARMTYYREQFRRGNLQVLCSSCNSKKGATAEARYQMPTNQSGNPVGTGSGGTSNFAPKAH